MFCSQCGWEVASGGKYCSHCGILFPSVNPGVSSCGIEEFKKRKEVERRSKFEPKAKRGRGKSSSSSSMKVQVEKDVAINIGFRKYTEHGHFKTCRGKTLPIRVPPTANASQIKERAVRKHTNHDKALHECMEYVLLYPDGSVVDTLPGTSEPFKLQSYREEVGKNYNRVTLFIALQSDYQLAELAELSSDILEGEQGDGSVSSDNDLDKSPFTTATTIRKDADDTVNSAWTIDLTEDQLSGQGAYSAASAAGAGGEPMAQCPTCFNEFPIRVIADHADSCCDMWVGEINDVHDSTDQPEMPIVDDQECSDNAKTVNDQDISLQDVIMALRNKLPAGGRRAKLRVRRKELWVDVKSAQDRGKLVPGQPLKIDFIGEPAVDDGGPLREFFSGKIFLDTCPLSFANAPVEVSLIMFHYIIYYLLFCCIHFHCQLYEKQHLSLIFVIFFFLRINNHHTEKVVSSW